MSRKLQKNKWVSMPDEDDVKFLMRPFSVLHLKTIPTDDKVTAEIMWEVFNAAIMGWEGLNDDEGKPLACNETNKRLVAEQFQDILSFVFTESISKVEGQISDKESKN